MAGEQRSCPALEATAHIPIAQLTPLLIASSSRSIKAVVTLTWPYSSATDSIAFLLSEPDFRLRRMRGQVRVQFAGSSAKSIAKAGIASGDTVVISLDGVEWVHNEDEIATPGRGVEFELKFTERLLLQFQQENSPNAQLIDIDHPVAEVEVQAESTIPAPIPTPEAEASPSTVNSHSSAQILAIDAGAEWSSPAFIKRARTSYGSLFDSDYDPFAEEDGTVRGKGRKRTRLSSTWRYSSRSPTPETPEEEPDAEIVLPEPAPKSTPMMLDEGCQTMDMEYGDAAEALADFARQSTNVMAASYDTTDTSSEAHTGFLSVPPPAADDEGDGAASMADFGHSMLPPVIQTGKSPPQLAFTPVNPTLPQSPRLEPVPSELLPLVSPIMSTKYAMFPSTANGTAVFGQASTFGQTLGFEQIPPAFGLGRQQVLTDQISQSQHANSEDDDLYGASPARKQAEYPGLNSQDLQNAPAGANGTAIPMFSNSQAPEDQYGQWQLANTGLSRSASPPRAASNLEASPEYQVESLDPLDHHEKENIMSNMGTAQYPELDDGPAQTSLYPPLPEHESGPPLEFYAPIQSYPPASPRSTAMSRSQSVNSQVVDLTESDDEEGSEVQVGEAVLSGDEEEYEGSIGDEGSLQFEQRRAEIVGDDFSHRSSEFGGDEDAENEEDFEVQDDDDEGSETPGFNRQYNSRGEIRVDRAQNYEYEEGEEDFDEEGSYEDEEMEAEEDTPAVPPPFRGQPEVIDLLSSDEDEDEPASTPVQTSQLPRNIQQGPGMTNHREEDYESEESDEDSDQENDVPYADRAEIRTAAAKRSPLHQLELNKAESFIEEGEESLSEEDMEVDQNHTNVSLCDDSRAQPDADKSSGQTLESDDAQHELEEGNSISEAHDKENTAVMGKEVSTTPEKHTLQVLSPIENSSPSKLAGQPIFRSKVFGLDGSGDEPEETILYPTLPKEELLSEAMSQDQPQTLQASSSQVGVHTNQQLPTPDDTQLTDKILSPEQSFNSTASMVPPEAKSQGVVEEEEKSQILHMHTAAQLTMEAMEIQETSREASSGPTYAGNKAETMDLIVEAASDTGESWVVVENVGGKGSTVGDDIDMDCSDSEPSQASPSYSVNAEPVTVEAEVPKIDEDGHALFTEQVMGERSSPPSVLPETVAEPMVIIEPDETAGAPEPIVVIEPDQSLGAPKPEVIVEPDSSVGALEPMAIIEPDETVGAAEPEVIIKPDSSIEPSEPMVIIEPDETVGVPEPMVIVDPGEAANGSEPQVVIEPDETLDAPEPMVVIEENVEEPASSKIELQETDIARHENGASEDDSEPEPSDGMAGSRDQKDEDAKPARKEKKADSQEPEFTLEHPRRSHRRAVSTTSSATSKYDLRKPAGNTKGNTRPVTPNKSRATTVASDGNEEPSPTLVIDGQTTPKGHDASMELALSSLDSPTKPKRDLRKSHPPDPKLVLLRTLRTELSEFTALKVLRYNLNKKLDVLAVATETPPDPQRAKGGPRHYSITFNIVDPSITPGGATEVQVFRPYKDALPIIKAGDGVLLRNFQVISIKDRGFGLRSAQDEGSSWAVFKDGEEPEMRGPPVEFGEGETNHIMALIEWYAGLDGPSMAKITRINGKGH